MSGFREFAFPGTATKSVVYDLDFDDAHAWHQPACHGDDCWCDGLSPSDFLKTLHKNVLSPAHYWLVSTPPGSVGKNSIRLSVGPGINERDETQLRSEIGEI